jgi:hypothetical protein
MWEPERRSRRNVPGEQQVRPRVAIMADYRLYHLDISGHLAGPPDGLTCENDQTAIERAGRLLDGHDLELWQRDRLVIRLHSKGGPARLCRPDHLELHCDDFPASQPMI